MTKKNSDFFYEWTPIHKFMLISRRATSWGRKGCLKRSGKNSSSCRWCFLFNWQVDFPLFLFYPLLETMLLSKSLISRMFLKPNRKMHKIIKQLLTLFKWNQFLAALYLFASKVYWWCQSLHALRNIQTLKFATE